MRGPRHVTIQLRAFRRLRRPLLLVAAALAALATAGTATSAPFVPKGLLDGARQNPQQTVHVILVAAPGTSTQELKQELKRSLLRGGSKGRDSDVSMLKEFEVV